MEVLAIIAARGGSKGIPLKNLVKINGKPLIEYTVNSAKKSKLISRIIISTDSTKIAKIAENLGVEVPFQRPKKISGNKATSFQVINHALKFLEKKEFYIPDIVLLLQPTNPLRNEVLIDKAIRYLKNSKADTVVTVQKIRHHPFSSFWKKGEFLKPFKNNFQKFSLRQSHPPLYHNTGDVYAFWNKTVKKYNSLYGKKIKPIILSDDFSHIDIDTPFDIFVCEAIMKTKQKKLKY